MTKNIRREFDKKFLLVNGLHACAAYLGYRRGHQYICDVMGDPVGTREAGANRPVLHTVSDAGLRLR